MDQVYRNQICSEYINPEEVLKRFSTFNVFPKHSFDKNSREKDIKDMMNIDISDEEFQDLTKRCRPLLFTGALDDFSKLGFAESQNTCFTKTPFKPMAITQESLQFRCVQVAKQFHEQKSFSFKTWLKYRGERCPSNTVETTDPPNLVPGEEVLLRIRIYYPYTYVHGEKSFHSPNFFHDLIVLGSDTLDVLRDKILCANDFTSNIDLSEDPESDTRLVTKDQYKSGFLFIDNTFYNDFRDPNNIDYSECIREWAKTKDIGPFNTAAMENTTFTQLNIKLGMVQVYQHLGNCEHLFTFSDIEILQPSDICISSYYPLYKTISLKKARYCTMCGAYIAKWRVEESDRVPFNPAFFCEGCFHSYNYIDGKKVGNFKAYPYYDAIVAT